jgi:hypothetical protein
LSYPKAKATVRKWYWRRSSFRANKWFSVHDSDPLKGCGRPLIYQTVLKNIFKECPYDSREARAESGGMTLIPAKVVAVGKESDKHRVIVRISLRSYRGSFNTLRFGENKPLMGSCHEGRLELIYYRDPGLKEGDAFPLWTIQ